jgi:conjugal transfer pilus assembly protein TrbC
MMDKIQNCIILLSILGGFEVYALDKDIYAETMDWIQSDLMTSCNKTCKDQIPDELRPQVVEQQVFQGKIKDKPARYEGFNFFVFVSFSMPKQGLLELCKDIARAGGVPVLRGLYKNSFKETGLIMQKIVKVSGQGMLIDPNLYEQFNIETVPSFVITDQKQYDKLTGFVSANFALEQFHKFGDLKNFAGDCLKKEDHA